MIVVTSDIGHKVAFFASEVAYVIEEGPNDYASVHLKSGDGDRIVLTNMSVDEVVAQIEEEAYARK